MVRNLNSKFWIDFWAIVFVILMIPLIPVALLGILTKAIVKIFRMGYDAV